MRVVLPRPAFCDATICRPTLPDGGLAYIDSGHLNALGSLHLVPLLRAGVEGR